MNTRQYRNTPFLIELLVNVFVLCLSCAILVGVFVEASLVVADTNRKNEAGNEVYAVLQTLGVADESALPYAEIQPDGGLLCGYDEAWQPAAVADATYLVVVTRREESTGAGLLLHLGATAHMPDGSEICHFETSYYKQGEGGIA